MEGVRLLPQFLGAVSSMCPGSLALHLGDAALQKKGRRLEQAVSCAGALFFFLRRRIRNVVKFILGAGPRL